MHSIQKYQFSAFKLRQKCIYKCVLKTFISSFILTKLPRGGSNNSNQVWYIAIVVRIFAKFRITLLCWNEVAASIRCMFWVNFSAYSYMIRLYGNAWRTFWFALFSLRIMHFNLARLWDWILTTKPVNRRTSPLHRNTL